MGINMGLDNELRQLRAILANANASAEAKRLARLRIEYIKSFYDENA
jgi:hypothetical protein